MDGLPILVQVTGLQFLDHSTPIRDGVKCWPSSIQSELKQETSLPGTPTLPPGSVTSPTLLAKPSLQASTSLARTGTIQRSIRASEPDSVQIPGMGARDAVSMTDLSGEVTGRGLGAGRVGSMGSFLQQLRGAGEKGSLLGGGSSSFSQASVEQQVIDQVIV